MRVAIYVRVSTKEQALEGYSIAEQIERLTKFSEAHGWDMVDVYNDAGCSGANTDRPRLQAMMDDIRQGLIDKVLVYKLDRLSRSQKDTLELIENVFLKHGVDFESMTEKLDTSTAHGRAMIGILAAFAQLEREMISERMSMGIHARIKEGKWRGGGHVPFGYDYEQDKLVINEYQALIVQKMFKEFISGRTAYSIQREMESTGAVFRDGSVANCTFRYILSNKTYCGYIRYKNEWIKGLHEPIIDEETFNKAQTLLNRKEKTGPKNATVLGGLLYCGRCGARYSKVALGTKKYGYKLNYGCYSRHKKKPDMVKDPTCKNKYYKIDELDKIIFGEVEKLAIDPEYIKQVRKPTDPKQIEIIEKQIKEISNQISRFMDLYGLGKFSVEELDRKAEPLLEKRSGLQKELIKMKTTITQPKEEEIRQAAATFGAALRRGSLEQKREILRQLINKIVIDGDEIIIHWNF